MYAYLLNILTLIIKNNAYLNYQVGIIYKYTIFRFFMYRLKQPHSFFG